MNLTVMTFNLLTASAVNPAGSWTARLPLVVDVLRTGPDIVAFQEATVEQLADIRAAVPELAIVSGPPSGETRLPNAIQKIGRLVRRDASPRRDRGEHCAIAFRADRFEIEDESAFWLSHEPHVPGSVLSATWLPRVVNWVRLRDRETETPVTVYNAHMDFLPWAPARSARILRGILDGHWDQSPQILMGDFNAAPNSDAYKHLGHDRKHDLHLPLTDALHVAAEKHGPEGTFHGGTGRVRWIGRLDRILFRPRLHVDRITTVTHHHGRFYPSDHFPVRAELRLP